MRNHILSVYSSAFFSLFFPLILFLLKHFILFFSFLYVAIDFRNSDTISFSIFSLSSLLRNLIGSPQFSSSTLRFVICLGSICVRWSSGNPFGWLPLQYRLSRRSLIVIRSDCGAVQRLPMIVYPTIL